MKTIKITADNYISVVDIDFDDYRSIQKELGGYFEIISTQKLRSYFNGPIHMLVDEDGYRKELSVNQFATNFYYYGYSTFIVGDVILCKILDDKKANMTGLKGADKVMGILLKDFPYLRKRDVFVKS